MLDSESWVAEINETYLIKRDLEGEDEKGAYVGWCEQAACEYAYGLSGRWELRCNSQLSVRCRRVSEGGHWSDSGREQMVTSNTGKKYILCCSTRASGAVERTDGAGGGVEVSSIAHMRSGRARRNRESGSAERERRRIAQMGRHETNGRGVCA